MMADATRAETSMLGLFMVRLLEKDRPPVLHLSFAPIDKFTPWASPAKPSGEASASTRRSAGGGGRHHAVASDVALASVSSPTNLCQFAHSSRRSWLTRAAEIRNMRATRPVVSPRTNFSASRRSRFDNVKSQLAKSSRVMAISAGPAVRSSTRTSRHWPRRPLNRSSRSIVILFAAQGQGDVISSELHRVPTRRPSRTWRMANLARGVG